MVKVRLSYAEIGQMGSEEFTGVYEDTLPLGRAYFFVFAVGRQKRLVQTSHVVEMTVEDPHAT